MNIRRAHVLGGRRAYDGIGPCDRNDVAGGRTDGMCRQAGGGD